MSKDNTADIRWSSRLTFILASVGSAIGLANLWRFPYSVGTSGGSAFVFVFLAAVLLLSTPLLIAEFIVGRRGRHSPPRAIAAVAGEAGISRSWRAMGGVGSVTAVFILSFYAIAGGWTLAYAFKMLTGPGLPTAAAAAAGFEALNAEPLVLFFWFSLFIGLTIAISALGIKNGIENAVKVLMPALFAMLVFTAFYALTTGDAAQALTFLFAPDFSKITSRVALDAFGQAFFSLGVGVTNMMAYGAYISRETSIPRAGLTIAATDTGIALLAGIAIFPIVFATGLAVDSGPGLVFQTLPIAFARMPGGDFIAPLFFILLFFAALTSSISMMEAPVSWLRDRFALTRAGAALISGGCSFGLGILCVLSFNVLSGYYPLEAISAFANKSLFELFDFLTTTIVMPITAIFIAIFVGWRLPRSITHDEFGMAEPRYWYGCWRFCLRFVAPLGLAAILISGMAA